MATYLSDQFLRPIAGLHPNARRFSTLKPARISHSPSKVSGRGKLTNAETGPKFKWALRLSLAEQSPPKSTLDVNRLVDFLYEDLPHLFDDQGIDRTMYDERVRFRDPITKHDTIGGYLFNIALLKKLFRPEFQLHYVKQKAGKGKEDTTATDRGKEDAVAAGSPQPWHSAVDTQQDREASRD